MQWVSPLNFPARRELNKYIGHFKAYFILFSSEIVVFSQVYCFIFCGIFSLKAKLIQCVSSYSEYLSNSRVEYKT